MNCEMCGTAAANELVRAIVEGTELNLCQKCSRFGRVIARPSPARIPEKMSPPRTAPELLIIPNYARVIRQKREQMGLSQKEFAQKIAEKESFIHQMETSSAEPGIELARKLEQFLKEKLITQADDEGIRLSKPKKEELTLGDFVKVRKR